MCCFTCSCVQLQIPVAATVHGYVNMLVFPPCIYQCKVNNESHRLSLFIVQPCCVCVFFNDNFLFPITAVIPFHWVFPLLLWTCRYRGRDLLINTTVVLLPCRQSNKYFGTMWHLPPTFQDLLFWKVFLSVVFLFSVLALC